MAFATSAPAVAGRRGSRRQSWTCAASPSSPAAAAEVASPSRRAALRWGSAALLLGGALLRSPPPAAAAAAVEAGGAKLRAVVDSDVGYEFSVPEDWTEANTTVSGGRRLQLYIKDGANVAATATPVPSDYQKLSSFGSVDNVMQTILPRQVDGTMIKVSTSPNTYFFEYVIQPPNRPRKHLYTAFSLKPGQAIVSVTGQCDEEELPRYEQQLLDIMRSFRLYEPAD